MMSVCDKNHEPVAFEGTWCPVCRVLSALDDARKERDIAIGDEAKLRASVEKMLR